jgi:hypothetical protein
MRNVVAQLMVMSVCVAAQADESWFDGHWILDREATLAAWTEATEARIAKNIEQPEEELAGLSAEAIRASIEHARHLTEKSVVKLWDAQGETELDVNSGTIAFRWRDDWLEPEPYSLRPIEPGVFEVVGSSEGEQQKCVVHKTKTGFCRTACGTYNEQSRPDASCIRKSASRDMAPNHCMQPTPQPVIKFASANLPPAWRAADAGC